MYPTNYYLSGTFYVDKFTELFPLILNFRKETMNGTLDYCCTGLCVEVLQILAERTITLW